MTTYPMLPILAGLPVTSGRQRTRNLVTLNDELDRLLIRVAGGDRRAYAAVFERVAGLVFGVVRSVLRDPAMSEEVTQEVLLEVWRRAPAFTPARGSARVWVLTMAHRRAIDRVRAEQAHRDRTDRVATTSPDRPFDSTAEAVERRDESDRMRAALDLLTDLQREVIELAYYQGRTYREVAEALDVPLGTVKTRMRDGLLRLKDAIGAPR